MSTDCKPTDEQSLLSAIRNIRDDKTPTNWVLVGHEGDNPNALRVVASGEDGLAGLRGALSRETNVGEKMSFVKRGRFGVVKGAATKYFQPYHVDIEITSPDELTEEVLKHKLGVRLVTRLCNLECSSLFKEITKKVEAASGVANNVRDPTFAEGKQERGYTARMGHSSTGAGGGARRNSVDPSTPTSLPTSTSSTNISLTKTDSKHQLHKTPSYSTVKPTAATQSQGIGFSEELVQALRSVRDDRNNTRWVVGAYEGGNISNPVVVVGTGEDGAGGMKEKFAPDAIAYGLIRVTDMIDGHPTVKFAFITWIGQSVGIMKKAKISTHKGAIQEQFSPFHVDFTISERREIDDKIILDKVSGYSGSRSFVK
ncbi:hypothetical protein HK104_010237 [Borealophlyctis nickersoniae]|nr:hypothetical protein HK104_010237 [Borealophlyctis nickersoniae]